ncbi:MAG: hypothetical protein IJZ44_02770 [Lachnospiraceae bacterium]|nr:hypothetical protein [Lachnospiraceae bacterium]
MKQFDDTSIQEMYSYIVNWEENQAYSILLKSELMDARWYKATYLKGRENGGVNPVRHYLNIGWKEGNNPSMDFCTRMYLDANTDVISRKICPLLHYEMFGRYEKRKLYSREYDTVKKSGLVDEAWYNLQYQQGSGRISKDAVCDYLYGGWMTGKNPNSDFVTEMYLDAKPERNQMKKCPLLIYLDEGKNKKDYYTKEYEILKQSKFFHKEWYLSKYKSVLKSDIPDPYAHYLYRGWKDMKEPSPFFSGRMYLNVNKDVEMCPVIHYELFGKKEGREIHTDNYYLVKNSEYFDEKWYERTYLWNEKYGFDPVFHYLFWGWREGKNPCKHFAGDMYLEANGLRDKNICPLVHFEKNRDRADIKLTSEEYRTILFSEQFEAEWYRDKYMRDEKEFVDPLTHYLYRGWKLGYNPNKEFDTQMYLDVNKRVKKCPFYDYLLGEKKPFYSGEYDAIKKSGFFDASWYLKQYPEVMEVSNDPVTHYLYHGWKEGKNPGNEFDGNAYLKANPDVKKAQMCPLLHYELFGHSENRMMVPDNVEVIKKSRYFSPLWYQWRYKEVRKSGMRPEIHYLYYGWKEGKNPGPFFDGNAYLKVYDGVKKAHMCPLLHYEKCGKEEKRTVFNFTNTPHYRKFGFLRRAKTAIGNIVCRKDIRNNHDIRILVCLHLFYADAWKEVADYLDRLKGYRVDLRISYSDYLEGNPVLEEVKSRFADAVLIPCANQGYDIGPFIRLCEDVDLQNYDIVYKLHTKGITKTRFVYQHYFQRRDWFIYLFEGILGAFTVHKTISLLSKDNNIGMVSAFNLIAFDPPHKRRMMEGYFNRKFADNYQFVAGTCFAMRAELLGHFLEKGIRFSDFEVTERGKFSLAHAVERLICIDVVEQGYKLYGTQCEFLRRLIRLWPKHKYQKMSAIRLMKDERFVLDDDFFYRTLETKPIYKYEIVDIKLKDIKRIWKGKTLKLTECAPYKYLALNQVKEYEDYCEYHHENNLPDMSRERYDQLIKSIDEKGFDDRNIIVINQDNVVQDGQHRSCCLLYKYGGDYVVKALKVYFWKERKIY